MSTRGGAVRWLVGLITRRSQVQILPPLPVRRRAGRGFPPASCLSFMKGLLLRRTPGGGVGAPTIGVTARVHLPLGRLASGNAPVITRLDGQSRRLQEFPMS